LLNTHSNLKIYLAGDFSDNDLDIVPMKRRLFSYYYHHEGDQPSAKVVIADEQYKLDLFLDSGAFTAFEKDEDIDVEDYAAYVRNVQHRFTVCSSLDVIGDAQKSYDNCGALESSGCKVVPVFHAREDVRWLVRYLDEGYDYICIGGMVPESARWRRAWLDWLYAEYLTNRDGTPRVKLHGFGLTSPPLMFRYPWYSVDSTSWMQVGMYGACDFNTPRGLRKIYFSSESPQAKKLDSEHYRNLHPLDRQDVDSRLARFGVTAAQCEHSYIYRHKVNAQTFQEMEL